MELEDGDSDGVYKEKKMESKMLLTATYGGGGGGDKVPDPHWGECYRGRNMSMVVFWNGRRREMSEGLPVTTVMNRQNIDTKMYFIHKGEQEVLVKFLAPKEFIF